MNFERGYYALIFTLISSEVMYLYSQDKLCTKLGLRRNVPVFILATISVLMLQEEF